MFRASLSTLYCEVMLEEVWYIDALPHVLTQSTVASVL